MDETSEAYLHEELLSLLDAGLRTDGAAGAAIIDHDNIYASAEGYEYLVSRDLGRRKDGTFILSIFDTMCYFFVIILSFGLVLLLLLEF